MLDSNFRPKIQKLILDPIANWAIIRSCSPLMLSIIGLVFGVTAAILTACQWIGIAAFLLFLSGLCDALDGSVARKKEKVSNKGAAIDIVFDRVVEFAMVIGLYFYHPHQRALECLLMMGCILICVTTFLVVSTFQKNQAEKGFLYSPGIIERAEAFLFFFAMILFPTKFSFFAATFCVLTLYTAVTRLRQFLAQKQVDNLTE